MQIPKKVLGLYLLILICLVSNFCYSQQTVPNRETPTMVSKTDNEKKDLIINTKMDTLSVIFQNTLIPIRSFSQLDSFVRFNLMGLAKPRVEIRGYPGDTSENYDRVVAILKKNKISDFSFGMMRASP